jgi:hypothetical protein
MIIETGGIMEGTQVLVEEDRVGVGVIVDVDADVDVDGDVVKSMAMGMEEALDVVKKVGAVHGPLKEVVGIIGIRMQRQQLQEGLLGIRMQGRLQNGLLGRRMQG